MQGQDPWVVPSSYHVTSRYVGGDKSKLDPNFQEGEQVSVQVRAVVYVPNHLIAGVVFPQFDIENEFPHMTLMISHGWAAVDSNTLLTATCAEGDPFYDAYEAARN